MRLDELGQAHVVRLFMHLSIKTDTMRLNELSSVESLVSVFIPEMHNQTNNECNFSHPGD